MSSESSAAGAHNDRELTTVLDLSMPGAKDAVSGVTDTVSAALTRLNVPEEKCMEIALAVQEALANAVIHGCQNDASKQIRCRLEWHRDGRIVIVVTDPGSGFRVEDVADPNRPEGVYADHGRGVYLIRQLMDEVHFENGGNQIRMWKY
jgi:serine/threonine-protein kinase RsbW